MAAKLSDVSNKTFDYVICGAGTAGLTLAARLSEDPSVSVVVLEAGDANLDDPNITLPSRYGHTIGNPKYDWFFQTTKQEHSNGRVGIWSRGKGLGGTSGVNFHCWIKPPAADFDAIEKLGNPGDDLDISSRVRPALKRYLIHSFIPATEAQTDRYPHTYDIGNRGTSGPIQTTVPHHFPSVDKLFQDTLVNRGVKAIVDPYGGDITGTWIAAANLDPKKWTRSYSATAFYQPNKDRTNLAVLAGAHVSRVLFAASEAKGSKDLTATGLEFLHGGSKYVVHALKEIVLSAGTIKSPHILELSGIGRPEVLSKIGVDVKIDLPGVGENVQEHPFSGITLELNPNLEYETLDVLRDPEYAAKALELHAEGKGEFGSGITSFAYIPLSLANPHGAAGLIEKATKSVEALKADKNIPPGRAEQYDIQLQRLKDDKLPDFEFVGFPGFFPAYLTPQPGKKYISMLFILNHPFSRGTIHATTSDSLVHPEIDPHYFENDFDLENLVEQFKFVRSLTDTEPWKSGIDRETDPGPECQTDEQIRKFLKDTHSVAWHAIGSCSMLPRDKQGVVDPELKVYGTSNLRVADLSIYPLHLATHTQTLAYAVGGKSIGIDWRGSQHKEGHVR